MMMMMMMIVTLQSYLRAKQHKTMSTKRHVGINYAVSNPMSAAPIWVAGRYRVNISKTYPPEI